MEINGEFKMKSTDILLKERGLEDMGRVQKYIDNAVINYMKDYTPFQTGTLQNSPHWYTKIGSGMIGFHTLKPESPSLWFTLIV